MDIEEQKVDQVVSELGRYRVVVGALQETSEVYRVNGCMVLTAGREVTGDGQVRKRGEGVATVLTRPAVSAWGHFGTRGWLQLLW